MAIPDGISQLPVASYSTGDRIIAAGGPPDKLRFLKSGRVEVVRDGNRIALTKTPGGVLGELSLQLDTEATADVVALEDTEVHVADAPLDFLQSHPEICLQVAKILAYRLNAASPYLVDVKD